MTVLVESGGRKVEGMDERKTYKMANLRGPLTGLMVKRGSSVKQRTNRARAARLRPPKMSKRSHRLTAGTR